jgi:peptidyl-prolyl cis-trans isomerase C
MTMTDLRRSLERSMIVQRVQQNEVFGKIGISEEEARAYYDSHRNEFTKLPTVTLREILVAIPADARGVNVAAEEAAKQRADQLRTRVTTGREPFDKVASEASDAPSKANAGLIGPISLDDLSPDLRKVVETLQPDAVSDVIRTSRGFQLFKLETSTPIDVMPFEQAREQIGDRVFTDKRKGEFQKYLEKLRNQAIIEWKNQDVQRAFEEGLKQQIARPVQFL